MHSDTKAFLKLLAEQQAPGWPELTPQEGRRLFAKLRPFLGDAPPVETLEDQSIHDRFTIRIIRPSSDRELPVVMYFHGGGWVLGDAQTHTPLCWQLAQQSNCAVVVVDYRRAPEHPFPAAFEDCYDATAYIHDHAAQLGLDATRMAVAGDSAGGNLAIAVALKARASNGPPIRNQVLIYPVVEPVFETKSYEQFADGYGLTRESMIWFWKQYLGEQLDCDDPHAIPTRATSLEELPTSHVITAEFDVLRDEGESLAARLAQAGVPTSQRRYEGVIHGFIHLNAVFEVGRQAIRDIAQLLARELQAT